MTRSPRTRPSCSTGWCVKGVRSGSMFTLGRRRLGAPSPWRGARWARWRSGSRSVFSESDAHLILSDDNSAARLLTRPGEAIYNDANGMGGRE